MSSRETPEAVVRGGKVPDKSSAGDDMPRGPQHSHSHTDDEGEERGVRISNGVHTLTTRAQVHGSNEDTDSIVQLPMSNGVHTMTTRFKARTSTQDTDPRTNPPRHQEIYRSPFQRLRETHILCSFLVAATT